MKIQLTYVMAWLEDNVLNIDLSNLYYKYLIRLIGSDIRNIGNNESGDFMGEITKKIMNINPDIERLAVVQLYAASVFILVIISSLLAFNALDFIIVFKILSTCATLIGLYYLLLNICGRHGESVILLVGFLILLPFINYLRYLVFFLGIVGLISLIRPGIKIKFADLIPILILILSILGADIYSNFLYQNNLLDGSIWADTLFHASIAAMYGNYGVASLGLDGLVPIAYHTLSHKIISGAALLGRFDALAGYSYLFFSLGPLLLAFSMAGLSSQLNDKLYFTRALLGISILFIAFICLPFIARFALWYTFYISESYLFGLVLLVVSLSTLMRWIDSQSDGYFQLIVALSLLILAGLAKGSVGIVGICVFYLLGITKFRFVGYWLIVIIFTFLLYFEVVDSAAGAKQVTPINLFHFVSRYCEPPFVTSLWAKVIVFVAVQYSVIWVCFAIGIRKFGANYFGSLEFQILIALLMPAMFFTLTFEMVGGSGYYFSSIPWIVSLAFILSNFAHLLDLIKFKHVVLIAIFTILMMHTVILNKSFVKKSSIESPRLDDMKVIVKQLRYIRDNTPKNTLVKIDNPEVLMNKFGCQTYWYIHVVIERPLVDGLPDKTLCSRDMYNAGFFGLSDYKDRLLSNNFNVIHLRLGAQ